MATPRHRLYLLIAVVVLLLLRTEEPRACGCVVSPTGEGGACEKAFKTDDVFVARVRSISLVEPRTRQVRMTVSEAFRGSAQGEVDVFTGTTSCGYAFELGQTYLVYGYRNRDTNRIEVGSCGRTSPIERAAEDVAYLRGPYQQRATLGTIKGLVYVVDPGSSWGRNRTLSGVTVELRSGGLRWQTLSGTEGTFSFLVPPGRYQLLARAPEGFSTYPDEKNGFELVLPDPRACAVGDVRAYRAAHPDGTGP